MDSTIDFSRSHFFIFPTSSFPCWQETLPPIYHITKSQLTPNSHTLDVRKLASTLCLSKEPIARGHWSQRAVELYQCPCPLLPESGSVEHSLCDSSGSDRHLLLTQCSTLHFTRKLKSFPLVSIWLCSHLPCSLTYYSFEENDLGFMKSYLFLQRRPVSKLSFSSQPSFPSFILLYSLQYIEGLWE